MSFPPRFGVPQIPTTAHFVSLPYGTVSMVPVVPATHYIVPAIASPVIAVPPRPFKRKELEKSPPSTVFVGNIHEKANNDLMRALLQRCGMVTQWKRVHGSNGRFQAFGFCEFDNPESTLRAVRLLNNFNLGGKRLLIKCDDKARDIIKEHINKRRSFQNKPLLQINNLEDIPPAEFVQESYESFVKSLKKIVLDTNEPDLLLEDANDAPVFETTAATTSQLILPETEEAEKDKLQYIEREIKQFRSTHKDIKKAVASTTSKRRRHHSRSSSPVASGDGIAVVGDDDARRRDDDTRRRDDVDVVRATVKVSSESNVTSSSNAKNEPKTSSKRADATPTSLSRSDAAAAAASTSGKIGGDVAAKTVVTSPISSRASSITRRSPGGSSSRRRDDKKSSRRRSRSRVRTHSRSRSRRHDSEEEEEIIERKLIERKIREKEYAYQERLRKWEDRERKKEKEYEKRARNEKQLRKEQIREAKKLKEFFEDYDDETEDPKYYRGKSYDMRRRDYERERDLDLRDRQKEREELDEIRRKLLSEGVEDPEKEISRIQKEQEERLLKRLRIESSSSMSPPHARIKRRSVEENDDVGEQVETATPSLNTHQNGEIIDEEPQAAEAIGDIGESIQWRSVEQDTVTTTPTLNVEMPSTPSDVCSATATASATPKAMGFAALRLAGPASRFQSAIADGSEVANAEPSVRRPLVPLEYSEEENRAVQRDSTILDDQQDQTALSDMTVEEKRKAIKALIEKIPTDKEELFAYQINWSLVDSALIEKRLKPWVNKKIVEYIGEEEPSLVEFICQKVAEKSSPDSILEDISMVLDEEARVFVVKLWRLLIYEIEAKRYGLVKVD